jgi:hypothetical protein
MLALANINTSPVNRFKCILILLVLSPFYSKGQEVINGKYFYHSEVISGDFSDKPQSTFDSALFFYEKSGDTLIYWTVGTSTFYDKKEFNKIQKAEGFGKYLQKGLTLNDGRITVHRLSPTKFKIRNDSLFQWLEVYKIGLDSMYALVDDYEKAKTKEEKERLNNISQLNTEKAFVFIFSPGLFETGVQTHVILDKRSKCPNEVTLKDYWVNAGTAYFHIDIYNNCGLHGQSFGHNWNFIISQDFEFVTFGGYGSKEPGLLTDENRRIDELMRR